MFAKIIKPNYSEEELEWIMLTHEERVKEMGKLWSIYLSLGGSLDPEPDPQSPFNFLYYPEKPNKSTNSRQKRLKRKR